MATLVLGTIGRVFAGPVGGLVGTVAGGFFDRALLGGRAGGGGRSGSLNIQSAAYNEAIPVVIGRMRVAGNLIWSNGIVESVGSAGKRNGASASAGYVYTASFAVGLGAGPIAGVGRIWADGRLIRGGDGAFLTPTLMRWHTGDEGQAVDPLIAAAEGPEGTPAYRGLAYAVFEDLALVDFGNRIPNLTFEVVADTQNVDLGTAIRALAKVDGRPAASVAGPFPAIAGYFAAGDGSIADNLASPLALSGASITAGAATEITAGRQADCMIDPGDRGTRADGLIVERESQRRLGGETRVDTFEVSYLDVNRDHQLGLQRASRGTGGIVERQVISAAMAPEQARSLAETLLARAQAARIQTVARLPWRYLGVRPGMIVKTAGDMVSWRVREVRFEAFVVHLALERCEDSVPTPFATTSGRALVFEDAAPGSTTLTVLDLPLLPGEALPATRFWVGAAGTAPGWRGAAIEMSLDGGISHIGVGDIARASVMGKTVGALPVGQTAGWDRFSTVDVELLSDQMWLEGRPEVSVLAGANLAVIGDELLQFAKAEALAPRVFRLSGLLRGRRGTEGFVAGHENGDRFVLIDQNVMLASPVSREMIGAELKFRSIGAETGAVSALVSGRAAQPLSPAHLRLGRASGDIVASWIRRSRDGFGWADFVDAPIAEANERYQIEVWRGGVLGRLAEVAEPRFVYTAAMQAADGDAPDLVVIVRQLSADVGPGQPTTAKLHLRNLGEPA